MMGKTVFSYISMSSHKFFMAIRTDTITIKTSWHIINVYHFTLGILCP